MTDCQVLDADTAVENQKLQKKRASPAKPAVAAAPAPVAPPTQQPVAASSPVSPPVAAKPQPAQARPRADYELQPAGNWLVTATHDRFGDGGTFIAMTGDGSIGLAVRCLQKTLSIGLVDIGGDPKPLQKDALFKVRFKVDDQPIVDSIGIAISERLIQVITEQSLVKSIREGKETALRLEDAKGVSSTHVYDTNGGRRAFADLSRECPLE